MDYLFLKEKLQSKIVSPRILLSNVKFLNESLRSTSAFMDPINLPFYYHLGKQLDSVNILQIGVQGTSAYIGPCILQSCKSVKNYTAIDEQLDPHSVNFVASNLRAHATSETKTSVYLNHRANVSWDVIIVSCSVVKDKFNEYLKYGWDNLKEEGLLVADYISESRPTTAPDLNGAFLKFCRVKNREPVIYETRNGVGIITR